MTILTTFLCVLILAQRSTGQFERTIILIRAQTLPGENLFIRGGITDSQRIGCNSNAPTDPCSIPIRHRIVPSVGTRSSYHQWSQGDQHLDWYGEEEGQGSYQGTPASGTPMMWTTYRYTGSGARVEVDGHGYSSLNRFGEHFWMVDLDMDCSETEDGWFEFKTFIEPLEGWEQDISQFDRCGGEPIDKPYNSNNHMGICGRMNMYYGGQDECSVYVIPSSPGSSPPGGCGVRRMFESPARGLGASAPWIVGGTAASVGRWPWQGVLQYNNVIGGCGGILIHPGWALTAAHCVRTTNPAILRIRFGEQNLQVSQGTEQAIQVRDIIIHHRYGNPGPGEPYNDRDIALLQLSRDVDMTRYDVNSVCLPRGYSRDAFVNDECWATGFGGTQGTADRYRLNEIRVPVWSHADCVATWGADRVTVRQVCMGTADKSACGGDSGGPLVCWKDRRWVLVGMTSWGTSECRLMPSVYTRITEFLDWIMLITGIPFDGKIN